MKTGLDILSEECIKAGIWIIKVTVVTYLIARLLGWV